MNSISICNTSIREFNGLYSLNDLHQASGGQDKHSPRRWLQNQQTIEFANECEKDGIPSILKKQGLGTFVCKELVIHYAMWISPSFSLQVIQHFLNSLSGSLPLQQPQLPTLSSLDDDLILSIGRVLLHAQDMRLFVNRYLPAFENLGITNHGALWSYVHDTEPTFKRVREFFLQQTPYKNHHLFADDTEWVRRKVIATAKTH